ncbi:ketohexokinase-like [Nylanderia fulva]|uniref:ketohexokinase-like n=1 Tax=Nylanderia fulva TaxID=613905 RepID=UPI0010FADAB7|nr:ketohexokinase-like [Nylanderia fulva]
MTTSPEDHVFEEVKDDASSTVPQVTKILCVGRACLDIVHTCQQFPAEDSTQRSIDYRWQRGGNASNTCTVLSLLGQSCEILTCLCADEHDNFIQNDLRKYKIDYSHCPIVKGFGCVVATIILSLSTGTRTIVYHNQNIPELTVKNFEQLNLAEYSWVHFEGRNIDEMLLMTQCIENYNKSLRDSKNCMPIMISMELENPKSGARLLDLLSHADLVFISKDFAKIQGFNNMKEVIHTIGQDTRFRGAIICAWGEEGAIARTPCGVIVQSPAFPPYSVIDTLGAGDTFNAAVLYYLNKSKVEFMCKYNEAACVNDINKLCDDTFDSSAVVKQEIKQKENLEYNRTKFIDETVLHRAIRFACSVAGAKVGSKGYDFLDKINTLKFDFSIL